MNTLISDEDEEIKLENETIEVEKSDMQNTLRTLQAKLEDLTTCQGLIGKMIVYIIDLQEASSTYPPLKCFTRLNSKFF